MAANPLQDGIALSHIAQFASQGALQALSLTCRGAPNQVFGPCVNAWHSIDMADWPFAPKDIKRVRNWVRRRDSQLVRLEELGILQAKVRRDPQFLEQLTRDYPIMVLVSGGVQKRVDGQRERLQQWAERLRMGQLTSQEEEDLLEEQSKLDIEIDVRDFVFKGLPPADGVRGCSAPLTCEFENQLFAARLPRNSRATDADLLAALQRLPLNMPRRLAVRSSLITDVGLLKALRMRSPVDLLLDSCSTYGRSEKICGTVLGALPSLRRLELHGIPGGVATAVQSTPDLRELYVHGANLADIESIATLTGLTTLFIRTSYTHRNSQFFLESFFPLFSRCTQLRKVNISTAVSCNPRLLECIMDNIRILDMFAASFYDGEFDEVAVDETIAAFYQHYNGGDKIYVMDYTPWR